MENFCLEIEGGYIVYYYYTNLPPKFEVRIVSSSPLVTGPNNFLTTSYHGCRFLIYPSPGNGTMHHLSYNFT